MRLRVIAGPAYWQQRAEIVAAIKPLCTVCKHWDEGDACAYHACPGRQPKRRQHSPHNHTDRQRVSSSALSAPGERLVDAAGGNVSFSSHATPSISGAQRNHG